MVVTTVMVVIACDDLGYGWGFMHTFMDVDGVVDMHPSTFPSFTGFLPFLRCLPPSLPPLVHPYMLHANRQIGILINDSLLL